MVVDIGEVKRHIKQKADSTLRNMRKDELIEYIRCLENNYNVAVSFNENQAKHIESLGALPVWIPVSERLPEELKNVLAYTDVGSFAETAHWTGYRWEKTWDFEVLYGVTHWMPLPEAPNGERRTDV